MPNVSDILRCTTHEGRFASLQYQDDALGTATMALAERCFEASARVTFEPLPDGYWEVTVREDRTRVLQDWLDET